MTASEITSVGTAHGHRMTDAASDPGETWVQCLACGEPFMLCADASDPTRGEYLTPDGDTPPECEGVRV